MWMSRLSGSVVLAWLALLCVSVCVDGKVVSAPSARWAHPATESVSANGARRFTYAGTLDRHGRPTKHAASLPLGFDDARATAEEQLLPSGVAMLKYDVEMMQEARVLDEDSNVQSVVCGAFTVAPAGQEAALSMHVQAKSLAEAQARYAVGTVVHGSAHKWGCVDGAGQMWTILMRVRKSTVQGDQLLLTGAPAAMHELFSGQVLLQQPSLKQLKDAELLSKPATLVASPPIRTQSLSRVQSPSELTPVTFVTPLSGDYQATDSLSVQLTSPATIWDWSRATLTLKRVHPLKDEIIQEMQNLPACESSSSNGDCTFTLPASLGQLGATAHLEPYFLELAYNCELMICVKTSSPLFWIPEALSGDWSAPVQMLQANCASECSGSPSDPTVQVVCELCQQGRSLSFDIKCADCALQYGGQVSMFSLTYSADPLALFTRAELAVDSHMDAHLDLSATVDVAQTLSGSIDIFHADIPPPPGDQHRNYHFHHHRQRGRGGGLHLHHRGAGHCRRARACQQHRHGAGHV